MSKPGEYTYKFPRPMVTVDAVIVRERDGRREVLLIQRGKEPFKGQWALPGGFVDMDEPLQVAASRELKEETGVEQTHLDQVGAFGDPGRDPRGRNISVAFVGRVPGITEVKGGDDADDAAWFPAGSLPELAFDHDKIIAQALEQLEDEEER